MKYNLEEVLKGNYIKKTLKVNSREGLDQLGEFYGETSLYEGCKKFPIEFYAGNGNHNNNIGLNILVGVGYNLGGCLEGFELTVKEFFELNGFTPRTKEITKKPFFFEPQGTYTIPETILSYCDKAEMEELESLLQELKKFML